MPTVVPHSCTTTMGELARVSFLFLSLGYLSLLACFPQRLKGLTIWTNSIDNAVFASYYNHIGYS